MRTIRVFHLAAWVGPMHERDAATFGLWLERKMPHGPHPVDSIKRLLKQNGFKWNNDTYMMEGKILRERNMRKSPVLVSAEFLNSVKRRPEFYLELLGRGIQNEQVLQIIGGGN